MKFLSLAVLALALVAAANAGKDEEEKRDAETAGAKGKRGAAAGYSTSPGSQQSYQDAPVQLAYSRLAQVQALHQQQQQQQSQQSQKGVAYASPQAQYVAQPGVKYYSAPQQLQYEPQAVAYSPVSGQPAVAKASAASPPASKFAAYPSQPQTIQQPKQYSSAADVSSFSYSSPVVKYSNLGVLSQVIGRLASKAGLHSPQTSTQTKSASSSAPSRPSSQVAYTHQLQPAVAQPAAKGLYASSPSPAVFQAQAAPQKFAFVPQEAALQFASKYSASAAAPSSKYVTQEVSAPQYSQAFSSAPEYSQAVSSAPQYSQFLVGAPQHSQASAAAPQYSQASAAAPQYSQASFAGAQYSQGSDEAAQYQSNAIPQYSQASAVPQAYSLALPQLYSALQAQLGSSGGHASSTGPQTFQDGNGKDGQRQAQSQGQNQADIQAAYKQLLVAQRAYSGAPAGGQAYVTRGHASSASQSVAQPIYSQAPQYYQPQAEKYSSSPKFVYSQ